MTSILVSFVLFALLQNGHSETLYCKNVDNCVCKEDGLCQLHCLGKDVCKGSDKLLGCRAGYPCEVNCNASGLDSENSCADATIDGSLATDLVVRCVDTQACLNTRVICGSGECRVQCSSSGSSSEGSECKGLRLDCASSYCSIECVDGSINTCSNVRVNVESTTPLFECRHPGINNVECASIDAYLSPFVQTTVLPTPATNAPTVSPTLLPSVSPSVVPTRQPTTLSPTKATAVPTATPSVAPASRSPTQKPSVQPTPSPVQPPTTTPTTPSPTRATFSPSVSPTVSPTKATKAPTIFYYVVDGVPKPTPPQTASDVDSSHSNGFMAVLESTWLYGVAAGGITLCCFILICIRCQMKRMRMKKIASPAPSHIIDEFRRNRQKPSLYQMQVQSDSNLHDLSAPSPLIQPPPPTEAIPEDILRQYKKKKRRRHRKSSDKGERHFRISEKYEHDVLLEEGVEEEVLDVVVENGPGVSGLSRTNLNLNDVEAVQVHVMDVDQPPEQLPAMQHIVEEENIDKLDESDDDDDVDDDDDDDHDDINNDEPSKSHESDDDDDESEDNETNDNDEDEDEDEDDMEQVLMPIHENTNSHLLHFKSLGSMHSFISEMNMNSL